MKILLDIWTTPMLLFTGPTENYWYQIGHLVK